MTRKAILSLCRKLPHVTEDIKWQKNLVFSVGGKMFACLNAEGGAEVSFKTTPEDFARLTVMPGIVPAPYAARFHWVLVKDAGALPPGALGDLLRESHRIVWECLPARARKAWEARPPAKTRAAPRSKARRA